MEGMERVKGTKKFPNEYGVTAADHMTGRRSELDLGNSRRMTDENLQ